MGILYSAGPKTIRRPGQQAFALAVCSLALLGCLALCPAPAKAQGVDGWLVGYAFECCPDVRGQDRQFMALAYVPRISDPESGGKIVYFKYQVFLPWRALVLADAQDLNNMQRTILGRPYADNSREVLDFQRAVSAPVNGFWTEETWRAAYDYFATLKTPQTRAIGSRAIEFVPLIKERLDTPAQKALKDAVENTIVERNQIPISALEPFLGQEAQAIFSMPLPQAGRQTAGRSSSSSLPGYDPSSPAGQANPFPNSETGPDGSRSASKPQVYKLSPAALALVNSLEPNSREAVRQALAALTPDQQAVIVRLVGQAQDRASARLKDDKSKALQEMLSKEKAEHKDLVAKLQKLPQDLKARLKESGINPDGAFDSAKRQGLSYEIAHAWNRIENRGKTILKPLVITGFLTVVILILVLVGIVKEKNRPGHK